MGGTATLGGFGRLEGRRPGWALKGAFAVSIVIGVAVVVRRLIALSTPPNPAVPPQMAGLDAAFAAHATLTYFHILCALLFVLLLPFLFLRRTRDSVLLERAVFTLGLVVGLSAYAMSRHAVGGWVERSAVLVFNTLFLLALLRAYLYARKGDRVRKQRWMLRAIAILLGIATTRPVMGVFFATATLTHLTPAQFFGIAFWVGFSVNTLAIEIWLRLGRRTPARESSLV
jgi:hypothetical protein